MEDSTKRPLKQSKPLEEHAPDGRPKLLHREAFMLMIYRSEDGRHVETLWNSRDGVTPFIIGAKDAPAGQLGAPMQHVHWGADTFAPYHVPNIGDRVFVDLDRALAEPMVERQIEDWWEHPDYPMQETFESKDAARAALLEECLKEGAPATIIVTAEVQRQLYDRVADHERKLMERARGNRPNGMPPSGRHG